MCTPSADTSRGSNCARIVPELGHNENDQRPRATTLTPEIVVLCGPCWPDVYGLMGIENPRVGGSIPPLAIR